MEVDEMKFTFFIQMISDLIISDDEDEDDAGSYKLDSTQASEVP